MLVYGLGGRPAPATRTFDEGETVSARLDQDTAIYLSTNESGNEATCSATSADGKPALLENWPSSTVVKTTDDHYWRLIRTIRITTPADYDIACTESPGPFAIANEPDVSRFVLGLVALFVLSGLGVLIGAVLAIVVGVKRSNHRRRLTDQRLRGNSPARPERHRSTT